MKKSILALLVCVATAAHADCSLTNFGITPLNEMTSRYSNRWGGLYGTNLNNPPAAHLNAGMQIATNSIRPKNASGGNSSTGKIVLLSIGMSNTTQEWAKGSNDHIDPTQAFKPRAEADTSKNNKVYVVDGAVSGQDASTYANPNHPVWNTVSNNLFLAGVSSNQVQVVWLKQAAGQTSESFPQHALTLQSNLESIVLNIKAKFTNTQIVYVSSRARSYAVAGQSHPPEPVPFESGFATKWMIEKQISGNPKLRFTGANPPAPYLAWGPYLD